MLFSRPRTFNPTTLPLHQIDLIHIAQDQQRQGNLEVALPIYSQLSQEKEGPAPLRDEARERLHAIEGSDGFTATRFEFLAQNITDQIIDPASLGAMVGAGLTYRLVRFGLVGTATRWGIRSPLLRPTARLLAFGVEAPLFPIYGRLGNMALGRASDWSRETLLHDIQSSFLVLGGLKLFGALGRQATLLTRVNRRELYSPLIQSTAMYLGILSGHQGEAWFGLSHPGTPGQLMAESLVTLIHFNAAGRLIPVMTGSRLRAIEQDMDRTLGRWTPRQAVALTQALAGPGVGMPDVFFNAPLPPPEGPSRQATGRVKRHGERLAVRDARARWRKFLRGSPPRFTFAVGTIPFLPENLFYSPRLKAFLIRERGWLVNRGHKFYEALRSKMLFDRQGNPLNLEMLSRFGRGNRESLVLLWTGRFPILYLEDGRVLADDFRSVMEALPETESRPDPETPPARPTNLAQGDMERLRGLKHTGEMWRGGGKLRQDRSGRGVRAESLRSGAERHIFQDIFSER
ncbi:MAG: hypothetical protein R3257_04935, partial [bacterium]|nr:hypothetical protein [bacterium]